MHCNNVGFLDLSAILIIILLISISNFCFIVCGIYYLFWLNKYIIILKIIFIAKNNTVSLCTVYGTQWDSSHFLFTLIFSLLKYIT